MAKIKKGDTVSVLTGKDKGKSGKVLRVWPEEGQALVERLNLLKHFERRSQQNPSGGVIEREAPMPLAKLAILCPHCHRPSRVGWAITGDGAKQRICRRCKDVV